VASAWRRARLAGGQRASPAPDDELAELTTHFWRAYDERMAAVKFGDVARHFPALVGQAVRLGWQANKRDIVATISLNLISGVFGGYALFATTGVLGALFAGGPTPHRVRAALPSLILVAAATGIRSGVATAAGWAQSRLEPQVTQVVEVRLYDLTTQVELAAFDEPDFHDRMQRARDRGVYSASQLVNDVINFVTAFAGLASAAVVVGLLQPVLLAVLLLAQLPGAWAAVRTARISYLTRFALVDSYRRKYILADLIADRRTAAELRSFTMREYLIGRVAQLAAYTRSAELRAARQETATTAVGKALGGIATAGVYTVLGVLLAAGWLALSVAGTAVLALRSAAGSLDQLMYSVNQCYEDGLYFSDYMSFCADARARIPPPASAAVPQDFAQIVASGVTFSYPGAGEPSLHAVSVEISRGEPTAALDARAEYALFSSLRTLARDRTVLLITHRLASVRHADRIYVLTHGKVTESGTHAELMALAGQYAELYTLQASQYEIPAGPAASSNIC
jgi:ATP-binding cassette, subfamily B, bacterial